MMRFVSYGSRQSMINGIAPSFGCTPEKFEEVLSHHEHKRDGTNEGSYQVVRGVMKELELLGYKYSMAV